MKSIRSRSLAALVLVIGATAACSSPPASPGGETPAGTGGKTTAGSGGGGGSSQGGGAAVSTGGSSGSGGQTATPGTGGGTPPAPPDAAASVDATPPPADVAGPGLDGGSSAVPPISAYGGVGETPFVPMHYPSPQAPPLVANECPEDPTAGFTEYQGSFKVQRPQNLTAADRFKYENGIYTFWVQSNDQSHSPGNGTAPRTEARYTDFTSGEHIWSADMMYEHVAKTCIMQIHNVVGAYAVYLRIVGDQMFDLATRKTVLTGQMGKWFNLKIAFNTQTLDVKVYVNNCLKMTAKSPKGPTPNWYFKHGVYTCESGTCRSHYKNIHLYQKGAMPPTPAPMD